WLPMVPLLLLSTCGGSKQSPVNIDRRRLQRDRGLGDILFEGYDQAPPGKWRLTNDGHTDMVLPWLSSSTSGGGLPGRYRALQLHFHWGSPAGNGSEHTLDGWQLPMEMHIVHMNAKYRTLAEAKGHPNGLAVLGFFFQVGLQLLEGGDPVLGKVPTSHRTGDSVDLASTFRLGTLLPHAGRLSGYYRYQGSLTTPDCSEVVIWTIFEEPVEIGREQVPAPLSGVGLWHRPCAHQGQQGRHKHAGAGVPGTGLPTALPAQLQAFVSTLHFPAVGSTLPRMTNNFRPPQPLHGRKVFASRAATASGGSPHRVPHQLLSPLLLLALLGPSSPAP
uniref:Uncharacterized protein n=1 Tax=Melopsittacus undulatus TaxID=13146 RepID=A0A8V5GPQ4_MELUD